MGDIDSGLRDRDENKPVSHIPAGLAHVVGNSTRYRAPLNSSVSSSGSSCLEHSNSSSSSKSSSPDHVVPTEKELTSPHHRLSTSSGSSSPQTDGSITFRRYVGPDVSRSSSSNGRSVVDEVVVSPQPSVKVGRRSVGTGGKEKRKLGSSARKESGKRSSEPQKLPKKRARKQITLAGDSFNGERREEEDDNESEADYVIRCICGFKDILGEQIQCEKCEVWQHFGCMGIEKSAVPDCYFCEICDPSAERPLNPMEARALHEVLLEADKAHSEERSRRKAKRVAQRKPSDASSTPPVLPLRQTDLMTSDKKKTDSSGGCNGSTSAKSPAENGGGRVSAPKDDLTELSRDDRKILQYEQMFKRMEERRDKKGRRKRNPEGSSNGSPSRDFGPRERDDESHEEELSTNAPLSPPFRMATPILMETVAVVQPQPLPAPPPLSQPPAVLAPTVFVPPKETKDLSFTAPVKESLPSRMKKVRLSKEEKAKARKDSSASESDVAEKVDKKKARYSMRLRNSASTKVITMAQQEDSRIELNCVKKTRRKEDADGADDELINTSPVMQPVKRRLKTASFVDSYYSAMADLQTESETQKASRRNRAYSASQEWEKVKVEKERSRLYHLYGLKKAVCARFNEEPIDTLLASAAKKLEVSGTTFKFSQPEVFAVTPRPMPGPSRITKRISSPDSLVATAMKRSRTVRAMIEESARKNADFERSHQASQQRLALVHQPVKISDAIPTRSPITAAEIISAATALRCDLLGKKTFIPVIIHENGKPANHVAAPSDADVIMPSIPTTFAVEVTATPTETTVVIPPLTSGCSVAALTEVKQDESSSPVTTPKKLSLAEYKQRKLTTQWSSDSLTGGIVIVSPVVSPIKSTSPGNSHAVNLGPLHPISIPIPVPNFACNISGKKSPLSIVAPTPSVTATTIPPPSRMTSVIQRIGTVSSNLVHPTAPTPESNHRQRPASSAPLLYNIPQPSRSSVDPNGFVGSSAASLLRKNSSTTASSRRPPTTNLSDHISTPHHHLHHSSSTSALNTAAYSQNFRPSSTRTHVVEDLKT